MESMEFEVRNQYGEVISEGLTLDQARETAKDYAEDDACDEIYDEPFTVVMCVPLETYMVKRPEPVTPAAICTCVTARTCVVGTKG